VVALAVVAAYVDRHQQPPAGCRGSLLTEALLFQSNFFHQHTSGFVAHCKRAIVWEK